MVKYYDKRIRGCPSNIRKAPALTLLEIVTTIDDKYLLGKDKSYFYLCTAQYLKQCQTHGKSSVNVSQMNEQQMSKINKY